MGREGVTLRELRAEMARLAGQLMASNAKYLEREAYVREQHAQGKQNFSGDLSTVLDNDHILNSAAGAGKTIATLAGAMAQVILAEIAYRDFSVREAQQRSRRGSPAQQVPPEPNQATGHGGGTTRGESNDGGSEPGRPGTAGGG